jgi:hypothetical protein
MKRLFALMTGFGVALAVSGHAAAQQATSPTPRASKPVFNPFASFSLNRFSFNTLGFLRVAPPTPFAPQAVIIPAPASSEADEIPQAAVRPPYRPPVRSPYRPPPRPPF